MLRRDLLGLGLLGILPPALAIGPRKPRLSVDAALDTIAALSAEVIPRLQLQRQAA